MKKFITVVASLAVLAGCAKVEINPTVNSNKGFSLVADVENIATKTTVNANDNKVRWSTGDEISVLTTGSVSSLTLSSGAGETTGAFSGERSLGFTPEYAVYPHNAANAYSEGVVKVALPASYNYSQFANKNTLAPMVAQVVANDLSGATASFKQVGGLLRVTYRDVPVGTDKFVVTCIDGSDNPVSISGKFTTSYTDGAFSSLNSSAVEDGANTVTVNFTALAAKTDMTFYVPMPCVSSATVKIALYAGATKVEKSGKKVAGVTLKKGDYYVMPAITLVPAGGGAPTTASMTSFSAISGNVGGDANVSYEAAKGDASTDPAVNSNEIRVYQNGGLFTVTAATGYHLKSVTIGSSMATSINYKLDGGPEALGSNASITAKGTYTANNLDNASIQFICKGTDKSSRLYVNSLSVTYASETGGSASSVIALATPIAVTASSVTYNSATLTWTGDASAESYQVEYKKSSVNDWTIVSPAPTTTTVNLSGLDDNTSYDVRLTSISTTANMSSEASDIATFSTKEKEHYTITWSVNGNTSAIAPTSVDEGDEISFPTSSSVTTPSTGIAFMGWISESSYSNATTAPTYANANPVIASGNATYYAVFATASADFKWVKTNVSDVTEGTFAILSADGYAFNGSISSGHGQVTSTTFSFDAKNEAASAPAGTCELTITAVTGGYTMYNSITSKYLYASAATAGSLNWHDTETSVWMKYSKNGVTNWEYKVGSSSYAYLRDYNNSFRTYSTNNGNVIQFAKKVDNTTYSNYCTNIQQ